MLSSLSSQKGNGSDFGGTKSVSKLADSSNNSVDGLPFQAVASTSTSSTESLSNKTPSLSASTLHQSNEGNGLAKGLRQGDFTSITMGQRQAEIARDSLNGPTDGQVSNEHEPKLSGSQNVISRAFSGGLHPAFYIIFWIACSSSLIIYNKSILIAFPYPIFLTSFHLTFSTILGNILAKTSPSLFPSLPRCKANVTREVWTRRILPIAVAYCFSLVFSNEAYLYLSVAIIQMLKGCTPVAVLAISYATGTQLFRWKTIATVSLIVFGIVMASYGELMFSWTGFLFQALGIMCEATRLVMMQRLLSGDIKMDPLTSILYFAPVCAAFNFCAFLLFEFPTMTFPIAIGPAVFLSNALVAFMLNVAVVYLIHCTSSLVLTLSGILKDILLIVASILIFRTQLTLIQVVGYGITLVGLYKYKTQDQKPKPLPEPPRTEMASQPPTIVLSK